MEQAWQEYLAATRRLAAVRQDAATAAAERQAAIQAARGELAYVRERLALQQREWPRLGVPVPGGAAPQPQPVGGGPAGVLDALRRTRAMVDEADALVLGGPSGLAALPPRLRNLFVYGPLAFLVLVAQLVVLSISSETPLYLPLCGLVMPAAAFGAGFLAIGLVFPAPPGGKVDRTPILGASVCLASVVLLCAGIGLLAISR
ncbi:MAG: hypothetical protein IRZ05_16125 [Micromonosporaceae bacterium]|jgi:hypothetical protein|nr:hypothetical protein [Micromonosporaceae bacterium]